MAEGGQNGERVETDAAEEVDHSQVDAQQLRAQHLLPPAVTDHQNQPVAQNREHNWKAEKGQEENFKSALFEILTL